MSENITTTTTRLTDIERKRMEVFGTRWAAREVISPDEDMYDMVSLWSEEPHMNREGLFLTDENASDPCGGYIGSISPEFFPSVRPGSCVSLD